MALIQGSNAANRLSARASGDTVEGLAGNDLLDSGSTDLSGVYLFGGDGNDTLTAKGTDLLIDGGAGIDTVRFAASVAAANLADADLEGVEKVVITSTTDGLSYGFNSQTEALDITGSRMVDSITGGNGNDTITGGTGADSLYGGAGDDVIVAEATDALIDGGVGSGAGVGGGNDTVQFAAAVSRTDLADGDLLYVENIVITNTGNAAYDFGVQGEILNITGGRGKDTITGGTLADTLSGGNGNDVLIAAAADALVDGGAGNDTVKYAATVTALDDAELVNVEYVVITNTGNDTYDFSSQTEDLDISGFTGNDLIKGGSGADALRGGGGVDTLHAADNDKLIDGGGGSDTAVFAAGVTAKNLMDGDLINVETISITGTGAYDFSAQSESLAISAAALSVAEPVTITGGKGVDTLTGGAGDDVIVASDLDVINGTSGNDTVRFAAAVSKVNLADTDLLNIDNIVITNTKAAIYDFSVQNEILNIVGGSGNDTIKGGLLADTLSGGAGNDVLVATDIDALIDGGTGTDTAYFGAAVDTTDLVDADLVNVENILLTDAISADFSVQTESLQISGSSGGDTIYGGSRADTIIGGAGADKLYGNEGADILVAETGDASIIGGDGDDTVKFAAAVASHSNDLWLVGIENVVITNTGNAAYVFSDQTEALNISGNSGADTITGGGAADTLSGGAGNDELIATATDALIDGGAGTDTVKFGAAVAAADLLNADLVNVENVVLTAAATVDLSSQTEALNVTGSSGNDIITGGTGADTLRGGAGDDTLVASDTDALIDGGANTVAGDTVSFASNVTAVNLTNAKLVEIEKVVITKATAGSYDFSAQTEALVITGGGSADTITGTQDWDSIAGGNGNDVLNGGAGSDTLQGGAGDDNLTGGAGYDTYQVAFGTDTIIDLAAGETLDVDTGATAVLSGGLLDLTQLSATTANSGTVIVTGTASADTIKGTAGVDVITGGAGADVMSGGAGANVFVFAAGANGATPTDTVFDSIQDWATGTGNKIDFGATALTLVAEGSSGVGQAVISAAGVASFNAADDTVAERIAAVQAAMTAATAVAGETAAWAQGADSYIFISDGVAGVGANDVLIKVVGVAVTGAGLTIAGGDISAIA